MGCIRSGMQITTILALTLPHVIFELPAIWIAGTAGFKVPYELIRYFLGRKEHILNKQEITDFLMLAVTALVLIVIAAFIEANITMKIAEII
jgi:stage II sporulation protein M